MDQQQPEQHSKFKSFLIILFVVLFMGGIFIAINWDLIKILFHAGQNAYETLSQDNAPSIDNLNINTIIESGLDKNFDDTLSIDMKDN